MFAVTMIKPRQTSRRIVGKLLLLVLLSVASVSTALAIPTVESPQSGSTLSGSTQTFNWDNNGTSVNKWWVQIGSSLGGYELYDSPSAIAAGVNQLQVSGLPTDGRTLYMRLWYSTSSWEYVDVQYTAATSGGGTLPSVESPSPGTQLSGSTQTFTWDNNSTSVNNWWVQISSSLGGYELYDSPGAIAAGVNQLQVSGLPTDGRILYVRLWYYTSSWESIDVQYTAASSGGGNAAPNGVINTPAGDVTISVGQSVDFTGTATDPDGNLPMTHLWNFGSGSGVPDSTAGDPGQKTFNSAGVFTVTYTTTDSLGEPDPTPDTVTVTVDSVGGGTLPTVESPSPGTQLSGSTQTFTWDNNSTSVNNWWVQISSSLGGYELYDSPGAIAASVNQLQVSGLPTDGRILYVRLWYYTSSWESVDVQYTAASSGGGNAAPNGVINTPAGDVTISVGQSVDFTGTATDPDGNLPMTHLWNFGSGSGVPDSTAGDPGQKTFNSAGVFTVTYTTTDSLGEPDPTPDTVTVTVDSVGGGTLPTVESPTPGTQLSGSTQTFTWDNNSTSVNNWWIQISSSLGGYELYNSPGAIAASVNQLQVSGLPTDGRILYVRLWYYTNSWEYVDVQYTAASSGGSTLPTVESPTPGTQLTGSTQTFTWDNNSTSVNNWWVQISSSLGGYELYDSPGAIAASVNQLQVSGLPTDGRTLYVRLWYYTSSWEYVDVQYTAAGSGGGDIQIVSPSQNALMTEMNTTVSATATGFPSNWSVEFVLNQQFGNPVQGTPVGNSTWEATLGMIPKAEHTLTAIMVDQNGVQQSGSSDEIAFGFGDWYVGFGDSITYGTGDDISNDNQSADGRNSSTGYTPILNDVLTSAKNYPHSVTVFGFQGFDSADALNEIDDAINASPDANFFLIGFGTNDSTPVIPIPSGLGLQPGDSGYPGTFKSNIQELINALQAAGRVPLIAKTPIRYGPCSASSGCQSYFQSELDPETVPANVTIRDYGSVVDELIQENGLRLDPGNTSSPLFDAPELYNYFSGTGLDSEGKSPLFFDWLHPNGVGYQELANIWSGSL